MKRRPVVRLAFIDVGQGDTIVITVPKTHEAVIVDCVDADAVISYLETYRIRYIRGIIILKFSSFKFQVSSFQVSSFKFQASSFKFQASNFKSQEISYVDRSFMPLFYMAFYTESLHSRKRCMVGRPFGSGNTLQCGSLCVAT